MSHLVPVGGYAATWKDGDGAVYNLCDVHDYAFAFEIQPIDVEQPLFMWAVVHADDPFERIELCRQSETAGKHLEVALRVKRGHRWIIAAVTCTAPDIVIKFGHADRTTSRVFAGPLLASGRTLTSPIRCDEQLDQIGSIAMLPGSPPRKTPFTVILDGVYIRR